MNRNHALVAVSTGLLRGASQAEADAVLAHKVRRGQWRRLR